MKTILIILLMSQMPALASAEATSACIIDGKTSLGEVRGNWGHRLGGDYFQNVAAQNSLTALRFSLQGYKGSAPIQDNNCFKHMEFDINETLDHKIVVHHHRTICTKVKNDCQKKDRIPLRELTLAQIRSLPHGSMDLVPEVSDVLAAAKEFNLKKRISVDIKEVRSDTAKYALMAMLLKYRSEHSRFVEGLNSVDGLGNFRDISLITNTEGFRTTFARKEARLDAVPSERTAKYWCKRLKESQITGVKSYEMPGESFCDHLVMFSVPVAIPER